MEDKEKLKRELITMYERIGVMQVGRPEDLARALLYLRRLVELFSEYVLNEDLYDSSSL